MVRNFYRHVYRHVGKRLGPVLLLAVMAYGQNFGGREFPMVASAPALRSPRTAVPMLTIRTDVQEVRVAFSVLDRDNRPVLDLARDHIAILDNDVSVPALTTFQTATDLPLHVALVIDASDSVASQFARQQHAGTEFLRRTIRRDGDLALLVSFATRVEFLATMKPADLNLAALDHLRLGGQTALFDAVVKTCEKLREDSDHQGRRAIVLISDGDDTYSYHNLPDALAAAVGDDTAIYTIALRKGLSARGEDVLESLANGTGGRAFQIRSFDHLDSVFSEIERDLRAQYVATYRPPNLARDGRFHRLKIVSADGRELKIRARAGYFAPLQ